MAQQPSLFDQPNAGLGNNRRKPEINLKKIEAELRQDAGSLSLRVRRSNEDVRLHTFETDNGLDIRINPKRIRTLAQLDSVMELCRSSINWT